MEVDQKLGVGAMEFFDALGVSVAYDVSQAVGKTVNPSQLYSGYRYKKKMKSKTKQEGDVDVLIKQFISPTCYEAYFRTAQGTNFIRYQVEALESDSIMVHYKEGFEGENTSKSWNYKLTSMFYKRGAKKRMERVLTSMEQYIKEQRKNG